MSNNRKYDNNIVNDNQARIALKSAEKQAEDILRNEDKWQKSFRDLERKLKIVPLVGDKLSMLPVLGSLAYSYCKKEYTSIPFGSILAIMGALVYFVSPVDLIPDSIPLIGYFDDAAVVKICWDLVADDVKQYKEWYAKNKNTEYCENLS